MAIAANSGIRSFRSFFNAPAILARHDTMQMGIFLAVNIVFGQIGIVGSLWLASTKSANILRIIEQNLLSGAFVTFAISLIVSAIGIVVVEMIDAARLDKDHVKQLEQKVFWVILGLFVLLLSTLHAGSIISAEVGADPPATARTSTTPSSASPAVAAVQPIAQAISRGTDWHQLGLWLASMIIATQVFCLYRLPLSGISHAEARKRDVSDMSDQAREQTKTSFNEEL